MEGEFGQGSVGAGEEIHRRVVAGPGPAPQQGRLRESAQTGARGDRGAEPGRAPRAAVTLPLARPEPAPRLSRARTAFRTPSRAAGTSFRSPGRGSACR